MENFAEDNIWRDPDPTLLPFLTKIAVLDSSNKYIDSIPKNDRYFLCFIASLYLYIKSDSDNKIDSYNLLLNYKNIFCSKQKSEFYFIRTFKDNVNKIINNNNIDEIRRLYTNLITLNIVFFRTINNINLEEALSTFKINEN